jgi:hypothetical protein
MITDWMRRGVSRRSAGTIAVGALHASLSQDGWNCTVPRNPRDALLFGAGPLRRKRRANVSCNSDALSSSVLTRGHQDNLEQTVGERPECKVV